MSSQFFTRRELCRSATAIKLGISNECPERLLPVLDRTAARMDRVRERLGFPITIKSGFRCDKLNLAVGGVHGSQHTAAEAVDFTCPAFGSPMEIVEALAPHMEDLGIDQLILEPGWVHASFTETPRHEILRMQAGRYSVYQPIGKPTA